MSQSIKVFLIDDHNIVRDGLRLILESDSRISVGGEARSLQEALDHLPTVSPDIILLDFRLPDGDGVTGCLAIKRQFPQVRIIVLTAFQQQQAVVETIRAGADGYLLKDIDSLDLIKNIVRVYEGDCVLDVSVTEKVFHNIVGADAELITEGSKLSYKEKSILQILSQGKSNCEIAQSMGISEKTVRNYISSIFKKMNVSNRTEAASYWIRKQNLIGCQ